jgi:hypothetical protein
MIPDISIPATIMDHLFEGHATIHSENQVEVNGLILSPGAIQRLAGCPAGGTVWVVQSKEKISFQSRHDTLIVNRCGTNYVDLMRDSDGYYLYPDYIWFADDAPKGIGGIALFLMAYQARALKLSRIELLAAGGTGIKLGEGSWSESYWGYQTWPRLGFDTELQPPILELMKESPHLAGLTHVSQVVATDFDWWKKYGDGWNMTFDLTPNSASWDTLQKYLFNRGLLK